jgi:uncharacterized protein (DUF1330 family)
MASCLVIVEGTFNEGGADSVEFKEYITRAIANDKVHGGVELSQYTIQENLGQGETPHFVVVLKYPSYEAAKETFNSKEYKAIIPLRDVVFKKVKILIQAENLIKFIKKD